MKIAVVGAGITGPVAALAFQDRGHEVTLFDAREAGQATSSGVFGIRHENISMLEGLGIPRHSIVRQEHSDMRLHIVKDREVIERVDSQLQSRKVVWDDLHRAAVRLVHDVRWKTRVEFPPLGYDYTVWADGIGSAGRRRLDPGRTSHYAGYVVYRGISDHEPWGQDHGVFKENGKFLFNAIPTYLGYLYRTEWQLYIPRDMPFERYQPALDGAEERYVRAKVEEYLPEGPRILVSDTPIIMASTIVDWDDVTRMVYGKEIVLGDAVAQMRPHTAMGANLGINHAISLPFALDHDQLSLWEASAVNDVNAQISRGRRMGAEYGLVPANYINAAADLVLAGKR